MGEARFCVGLAVVVCALSGGGGGWVAVRGTGAISAGVFFFGLRPFVVGLQDG